MFCSFVWRGCALLFFLVLLPGARGTEVELPRVASENLSTLGRTPDWSELEKYQGTITHDQFVRLLDKVYASLGNAPELFKIEPDLVRILTVFGGQNYFVLHFAKNEAEALPVPRWWTAPAALSPPAETGP
ncbi:MAG: hypothetical protein ACR2G0_01530, partial [Chthoniobacterales bacterium]